MEMLVKRQDLKAADAAKNPRKRNADRATMTAEMMRKHERKLATSLASVEKKRPKLLKKRLKKRP